MAASSLTLFWITLQSWLTIFKVRDFYGGTI
jgi:hypothetical protein